MIEKLSRVCVIGGAGYVGSRLIPRLLKDGYKVTVLDTFWYGLEIFSNFKENNKLRIIEGDIRDLSAVKLAIQDCNAVIHLACISNDPSFDLNPKLGKSINLDSFRPLVGLCKDNGIQRFIFASSSSVYGIKDEEKVTENLALEPLTDYSRFKAECEEILLEHSSEEFVTTILRPATVCGYSKRQRFDLAVNILTNHAINLGEIRVFGGSQFRPNLHIEDMVDAYLAVLEEKSEFVRHEIFNVGGENLSLDEIALIVSKRTGVTNIVHSETSDLRSYRVDSSKILEKIGFTPKRSVENAVEDLINGFKKSKYIDSLDNSLYFNIKRMKELGLG
jgi:nucleoside-diphosphate-sugar epimerase